MYLKLNVLANRCPFPSLHYFAVSLRCDAQTNATLFY